jgi:hypothetical protein
MKMELLNYAPARPRRRDQWLLRLRRLALLCVLIGVIVVLWRVTQPYVQQLRYLYWQWRCMRFVAPADQVAYEEDFRRVPQLAMQDGYQRVSPLSSMAVGYVPPPLTKLQSGWVCMAFAGERISAGGQTRMVVLSYQVFGDVHNLLAPRTFALYGSGKTPASLHPGSSLSGSGRGIQFRLEAGDHFRLFWGQRDPVDGSHFTISYLMNDQLGTIDGWLRENGALELRIRDGIAKNLADPYP